MTALPHRPRHRAIVFERARVDMHGAGSTTRSVAVRDGLIAAVGSRARALMAAGPAAERVDLEGARLAPAFHDAHTHLAAGSVDLARVDLRGTRSAAEVARRILEEARRRPADAWIRGFGWEGPIEGPEGPPRSILDRAAGDRPVFLGRRDGHAAWLSTDALRRLGIARSPAAGEPPGIQRAPDGGEPTGLVVERAAEWLRSRVPAVGDEERDAALAQGLALAVQNGLARLEDNVEPWSAASYVRLLEEDRLPCRVGLWWPIEGDRAEADALRRRFPRGASKLGVAALKVFLDGTLEARTAALREPYDDAPDTAGELRWERGPLLERAADADAAGWQIVFHAIGDAAVRLALDVLEALPTLRRVPPHRIEHAQLVSPGDFARIVAVGAAISIQPAHWLADRSWVDARLGQRRAREAYPWIRLVSSGAIVAAGSDWPVGPLAPTEALRAVEERHQSGFDERALFLAYTVGSAAAAGLEPACGRLVPGAPADLIVLDDGPDERWTVRRTYASGRLVFSRDGGTV